MKCKSCDGEIDIKSAKEIKKGNPSFYVKCPFCGATNHIKCRHKSGKRRRITITQKI